MMPGKYIKPDGESGSGLGTYKTTIHVELHPAPVSNGGSLDI